MSPTGGDRVEAKRCFIYTNYERGKPRESWNLVPMTYGEPFRYTFYAYHEKVIMGAGLCRGHIELVGE